MNVQGGQGTLPGYFVLFLPVFFAGLWILISAIISFSSGWRLLAKRFTRRSEPTGPTRRAGPFFYTVYMRYWTHYSSVIRLTAANDALYLSVMALFRFAHPPLQIPWTEIRLSRGASQWRRFIVLTLGMEEQVPMRISERMARKLDIMDRIPASAAIE